MIRTLTAEERTIHILLGCKCCQDTMRLRWFDKDEGSYKELGTYSEVEDAVHYYCEHCGETTWEHEGHVMEGPEAFCIHCEGEIEWVR